MLSPRRTRRLGQLDDRALWRQLLEALEQLDRDWDLPEARRAALQRAAALAQLAQVAATPLPPGSRDLVRRLGSGLERRELIELIVPLERALDRKRRDEDFLPISDASAPASSPMPLAVVADSLRSAFNVGGVFRTAECFGAERVWLTGYSADPSDPRVAKAAMGTESSIPWRRARNALEAIAALRGEGRAILALETGPKSLPIQEFSATFPCALLVGNERFGLASAAVEAADHRICIRTHGAKASLNVVAALGIALHTLRDRFDRRSP